MSALPSNWSTVCVGDVADVNPAGSTVVTSDDSLVSFLPMAAVSELSGRLDLSVTKPFGEVKKGFTRFKDGDVLFAKITPSMENGKIAVARDLRGGLGCGTTEFHVIRAKEGIEPDYLRYYFVRSAFRQEARRNMQGAVGQQRVPADFVRDSQIPVAPGAEQKRIVAKIEELFSDIEEGERALERVAMLVERYRQSVLKAAVTGEFTRQWREKHKGKPGSSVETGAALLARILKARRAAWEKSELDKMKAKGVKPANDKWKERYQEPSPPDATELPELPEGWAWASLDVLADVVGGITVDQKRSAEDCESVPYLRVANVQRGYLDLAEVKPISAPRDRIAQLRLLHGDILFNEGGDIDKLGRGWIWESQLPNCIHQNHVFRARLFVPGALNKIISWYGNVLGRVQFMKLGKQTTNLASLSLSKLKIFPLPFMSPAEADEIVSRAEDILSVIDKQVEELGTQACGSSSLRQAVLKAAFGGQLVPQVSGDEPASALLARIAAARATDNATPKRGHKKKTTA